MKTKKMMEVEIDICDNCGKTDSFVTECINCDFVACYDCRSKVLNEYAHAVYFSGSDDGYYCKPCDVKLSEVRSNRLYNAYVEIHSLRQERKGFYVSFDRRATIAQDEVKRYLHLKKK